MLRRFAHEAQILARLRHPGIAQIYEAGVADSGLGSQPFFAMECCEGRPLLAFVREEVLSRAQALELFARICDAVDHAHHQGVIHRDLKPGNILIERGHGGPQPKVLDFGVARVIGTDDAITTLQTDVRALVGTIQYMSPEQVGGGDESLDHRSDVYALGVLLYEMLSGRLPYELKGRALPEAARLIRDEEPAPLSSIDRVFRGDLNTVVGKALAKDRAWRYGSAAELARDIRHYLAGEPIEARRDSSWYVLSKQLRRYRWAAAAAVFLAALVTVFAVYAVIQAGVQRHLAGEERAAREAAQRSQAKAQAAQKRESEQRQVAEASATRAQAVTGFLLDTLGLAVLDVAQESGMTVDALLDRAAEDVAGAFAGQPAAEVSVRLVIGRAYASQGRLEQADAHLRRALELLRQIAPNDLEGEYEILWPFWLVASDLGDPHWTAARVDAAVLGRRVIAQRHAELASTLASLATAIMGASDPAQADALFRQVMEQAAAVLADDDPLWIYVADQILLTSRPSRTEWAATASAHLTIALDILRKRLPETNTRVVRTLSWLIVSKLHVGEHAEAERLVRESLQTLSKMLPPDHWYVAAHGTRLAEILIGQERLAEAEAVLRESHPRIVAARGEANEYAVASSKTCIVLYESLQLPQKADEYRLAMARGASGLAHGQSLYETERIIGPEKAELSQALWELRAQCVTRDADVTAALDRALALRREHFPDEHPVTAAVADALQSFAESHSSRGGPADQSRRIFLEVILIDNAAHFRNVRKTAHALWWLARDAIGAGQLEQAEQYTHDAISALESRPDDHTGFHAVLEGQLGGILMLQNRHAEAEAILLRAHRELIALLGDSNPNTVIAMTRLAALYADWKGPEESEPSSRTTLTWLLANAQTDGVQLNRMAWLVVRRPGYSREACALALRAAELAVSLEPDNGSRVNTLGAAQYRLGRFNEAVATLTRAVQLADGPRMSDHAFLAMSHARLEQAVEAHDHLARMREFTGAITQANDRHRMQIMAEAEATVQSHRPLGR